VALSAFKQSERPWFVCERPANPALTGIVTAKEEVLLACMAAREAYWDHVDSHGCHPQLVEVSLEAADTRACATRLVFSRAMALID
jgi:hypothetical protein